MPERKDLKAQQGRQRGGRNAHRPINPISLEGTALDTDKLRQFADDSRPTLIDGIMLVVKALGFVAISPAILVGAWIGTARHFAKRAEKLLK